MNKKNLPTMFIETISTKIESTNSQVYYDSRYKKSNAKWENKKTMSLIEKKLDGIISLVKKGNTINVYLELDDTYIEGILKEKRNDQLIITIYNKEEKIDISKIKDIIILND
jgi:hypothetical protein